VIKYVSIPHTEDIQANRNNNSSSSGYPTHILNIKHRSGSITDTMDIVRTHRKGKHLNTLVKYHINKISKDILQMNDIHRHTHNPIFKALHIMNTR
jgi:hypothetical protein